MDGELEEEQGATKGERVDGELEKEQAATQGERVDGELEEEQGATQGERWTVNWRKSILQRLLYLCFACIQS